MTNNTTAVLTDEQRIRASMTGEQIRLERKLTCEAIEGAIGFGQQGTNPPPSDDHWLAPFWKIGQQLALLTSPRAAVPAFSKHELTAIRGLLVGSGYTALMSKVVKMEREADAAPAAPVAEATPYFSGVSELIIRDVCEMEPANPDLSDTICIDVSDLQTIVKRHTESQPISGVAAIREVIHELRTYHPPGDPYNGKHIHPGWARRLENALGAAQAVAADGAKSKDVVTREQIEAWAQQAEIEIGWLTERFIAALGDFAIFARAAVPPATAEQREAGHGINGIPRAAFGPHTEADRIDHCGSCGAENDPQKDDVCPVCHAECSLVSTWGEFQHTRYRNGQRYANNGPQPWEDGPQPATAEACAHDYVRSDRVCTECGEQAPTAALPIKIPHVHIRPEDEEIGRQYYALGFVDGSRSITDAPQPATADERAALQWTAGTLQEIVSGRWKGAKESDKVSIGSVTKTVAQVLDMADAALGRASQAAAPAEAISLLRKAHRTLACAALTQIRDGEAVWTEIGRFLAAAPAEAHHSDDIAVDAFAAAMKAKMAAARAKGRGGWETCTPADLSRMLRDHVEKGDPRDVANFCMMLHHHGATIGGAADAGEAVARAYPDALTEDLRHVLGFPNFRCGPYAHLMRAAGADIQRKAEDEQAHVLHWLVKLVIDHGERWADVAQEELDAMREKVAGHQGAQGGKGGEA